jgi:hypothetical protein
MSQTMQGMDYYPKGRLIALAQNIGQEQKWLSMTNTLASCATKLIRAIKNCSTGHSKLFKNANFKF